MNPLLLQPREPYYRRHRIPGWLARAQAENAMKLAAHCAVGPTAEYWRRVARERLRDMILAGRVRKPVTGGP